MSDIDRDKAYDLNHKDKVAKCPGCGNIMANMGLDFEAPKKKDVKAWKHTQNLFEVGITFHSCGCSGVGYVPRSSVELLAHLKKIKKQYIKHRRFWSSRKEPKKNRTQNERQADWNLNGAFICFVPDKLKEGTRKNLTINIEKAIAYWLQRIEEVEAKIQLTESTKE